MQGPKRIWGRPAQKKLMPVEILAVIVKDFSFQSNPCQNETNNLQPAFLRLFNRGVYPLKWPR